MVENTAMMPTESFDFRVLSDDTDNTTALVGFGVVSDGRTVTPLGLAEGDPVSTFVLDVGGVVTMTITVGVVDGETVRCKEVGDMEGYWVLIVGMVLVGRKLFVVATHDLRLLVIICW